MQKEKLIQRVKAGQQKEIDNLKWQLRTKGGKSKGKSSTKKWEETKAWTDRKAWKGKGKGGKGKGKGAKGPPLPDELRQSQKKHQGVTGDGRRICYAYNLAKGCKDAEEGKECSKGWHVCSVRGCKGKHSATECTFQPKKKED